MSNSGYVSDLTRRALGPSAPAARRRRLVLVALLCGVANVAASPIVIRHDRDDARALELGRRYAGVVADITIPTRQDTTRRVTVAVGTLIAPDWVLTAGHVAAPMRARADSAHIDGRVPMVRIAGRSYRVAEAIPLPEFRGPGTPDIGLLRLASPVPDATPASLYTDRDELGQLVVIAGTGDIGTGLSGVRPGDGRLRAATNRIDEVNRSFISFRFDHPDSSGATELEGVSGPGDSGGPALVERDGRLYVAGVSSVQDDRGRPAGTYGVREYYARVSGYAEWIERTMRGHRGPAEPGALGATADPGPAGATSSGGMRPEIQALVQALFAAVESGEDDAVRAFAERHLSPAFTRDAPADAPRTRFQELHRALGRPELVGARREGDRLRLLVRSGRDGATYLLELTLEGGPPPRIAALRWSPAAGA